jgi:hypothetical protein
MSKLAILLSKGLLVWQTIQVFLSIDSIQNPAWKIASDTIDEQQPANLQISPLTIVGKNCSLKCISIVQPVLELDNSYKVFAFLTVLLPTVAVLFVKKFLFNVVSALCA